MLPHKRRRIILSIAAAGLLTAALVSLAARVPFSSDKLRTRIVDTLAERLNADVDVGAVWLRVLPRLRAQASELAIRHEGRRDVPPLIAVDEVIVAADLVGLWRWRVGHVELEGLAITIPPGGVDGDAASRRAAGDREPGSRPADGRGAEGAADGDLEREVVIDEVVADDASLTILRRDPDKKPRVWQMHELHVRQVGARSAMPFRTVLTNAVPPGRIETAGSFGPWHRDDPGHTPIEGAFTYRDADLSVFKGVSGMLAADGEYKGTLERIVVDGRTDTPDFMVNVSGHRVPLRTTYRATVDATNGNTTLDDIEAAFLQTSLSARGGVYEVEGRKGRTVELDVAIEQGRLEDVMQLAVKASRPPMTGALSLNTRLEIPPGDEDIVDKLRLEGAFNITNGRFTDSGVQLKINELSRRARGRKPGDSTSLVGSDFSGRFRLGDGTLQLTRLTFDVPGAVVELSGTYGLRSESLAFAGNLYMDAKVSETTSGWKSVLLKVVDPLFRKDGRTVIPIRVGGTRDKPEFGLDAKRVF